MELAKQGPVRGQLSAACGRQEPLGLGAGRPLLHRGRGRPARAASNSWAPAAPGALFSKGHFLWRSHPLPLRWPVPASPCTEASKAFGVGKWLPWRQAAGCPGGGDRQGPPWRLLIDFGHPHPFLTLTRLRKPPVLSSVSKVGEAQAAGAPGSRDGRLCPGIFPWSPRLGPNQGPETPGSRCCWQGRG